MRLSLKTLVLIPALAVLASCGGGGSSSSSSSTTTTTTTTTPVVTLSGKWGWFNGAQTIASPGSYGTKGVAAATNEPMSRQEAVKWVDSAGNFWLFGGYGSTSTTTSGVLNDLWEYLPATGQWTWKGGTDAFQATGIYGTKGVAAATNAPGARRGATSWTDASGNLWLFGGNGFDSTGASGYLNDLWKYSTTTNQWTWVAGSNLASSTGSYGTMGTAALTNEPPGRVYAASWTDTSGDLWLYAGLSPSATDSFFSDLWEFVPSTGEWTWMKGPATLNASAVFGTKNSAAATNLPGGRAQTTTWVDVSGNLWLLGGVIPSSGSFAYSNDLWRYTPSANLWTWVGGSQTANAAGVYSTLGVAGVANAPGARAGSVSWVDAAGNFWLFGGLGYAVSGAGYLNDLWHYSPSTGDWIAVKGAAAVPGAGTYGTKGVIATANIPGGRGYSVSWFSGGLLWMFGGVGDDVNGNVGDLNDLWEFTPAT
jgi:N-acetylneuraminic acid mutarotase